MKYEIHDTPAHVDMVAGLKPIHVKRLVKALESTFYIDAAMIQEAIQQGSSFNQQLKT